LSKSKKNLSRVCEAWLGQLPERRFLGASAGLLILLILLVYGRSFGYGFVDFDDPDLLLNNPAVLSVDIGTIFSPEMGKTFQPLRVLSYAIDHALWGFKPAGYHVKNTLLHALAALFLLLFLNRLLPLLRSTSSSTENRTLAIAVSLLFALHPVSVESVAWVTSRKYGLLGVSTFLSLWLFCEFRKRGAVGWLIGAVIAALAAAMSSPFGVVMPALIVMLDRVHRKRPDWRVCLPFILCLLVAIPLLSNAAVTGPDTDYDVIKTSAGIWWLPQTLAVAGIYLRNLLLPLWLNASTVNHVDFARQAVWIAVAAAGIAYYAWWAIRSYRAGTLLPAFCGLWMLVILAPVSGFVPISTLYADRYLYLPQIGFWLLLGHLLLPRLPRRALLPVAGAVVLAMVIGSGNRCGIWKDSTALWSDCVAKDDRNFRAHSSLASAYGDAGDFDRALTHFEAAIERNPKDAFAYYNLGLMFVQQGEHARARDQFLQAEKLRPDKVDVLVNLGAVHRDLGEWEPAIHYASEALSRDASLLAPWVHRGSAYLALGQTEAAQKDFEAAIARDANSANAHFGLGGLHMSQGRLPAAIASYKKAAILKPEEFGIHTNLGNAYFKAGQLENAVASYRQAVAIQPHPGVYKNLASALQQLGRADEAEAVRRMARQAQP
jgi:tetratricopeptide (TPR) repeat protein